MAGWDFLINRSVVTNATGTANWQLRAATSSEAAAAVSNGIPASTADVVGGLPQTGTASLASGDTQKTVHFDIVANTTPDQGTRVVAFVIPTVTPSGSVIDTPIAFGWILEDDASGGPSSGTTAVSARRMAIYPAGAVGYLSGDLTGATLAPTNIKVGFDGGSFAALGNISATTDYFSGSTTVPAAGAHPAIVRVDDAVNSPSRIAQVASAGATTYLRTQFIPGTTGYTNALSTYTGSSKGDVGNAWVLSNNDSNAPTEGVISKGKVTFSGIVSGRYPKYTGNVGVLPAFTVGWRFAFGNYQQNQGGGLVIQFYENAAATSCGLRLAMFATSAQFAYMVNGTTTNVGAQITLPTGWDTAGSDIDVINDGTNIALLISGTQAGSIAVADIPQAARDVANGAYFSYTIFCFGGTLNVSIGSKSLTGK